MGILTKQAGRGVSAAEAAGFASAWRVTTFLLVFVGFAALAATGEIHPLAIGLFISSWGFGVLSSRSPSWWQPWMAYPLTAVPLTVITIIVLMGRFESLLYLLMFLGLYKCNTLREPGDHMQALLMAFFMLLACTIITHSATYLGFILVFLVLTTLDLSFLTIARETERSGGVPAKGKLPMHAPHPLGGRLALDAIGYGIFILLLGYLLFLIMPHYSLDNRFTSNPFTTKTVESTDAIAGYRDDLTLKNINNIGLDERRVMDISLKWWPEGLKLPQPPGLWLRGTVLNQYDGRDWTLAKQAGSDWSSDRWYEVNFAEPTGVLLEQTIKQDLNQVERLFGAPMPVRFRRLPRGYMIQMNYLTWAIKVSRYLDPMRRGEFNIEYHVFSRVQPQTFRILEQLSRRGLKAPSDENKWLSDEQLAQVVHKFDPRDMPRLSNQEIRINTQLPADPVSDVIVELGHRHMTASSDADKILQLLGWMRSEFQYTLQPGTGDDAHPLQTFLTKTHRGHCEYFASAFVLLLRAQHIPARVVLGFYTSETYPNSSVFIVRQSCAHAWAEVWVNGYGWLTVDPTPPSYRGRSSLAERAGTIAWTRTMLRQAWQRYVLDYSKTEQNELMRRVMSSRVVKALTGAWQPVRDKLAGHMPSFNTGRRATNIMNAILWIVIPAMILAISVAAVAMIARRFWRRKKLARIYRSPVEFVNLLLAVLQNKGWKRRPNQTVAEFAGQIEMETKWRLSPIIELYQRCRFAGHQISAREEAAARALIRKIQMEKNEE